MTARAVSPGPIPRATYAAIVGERLRSDILDGTLAPGSQLNEKELSAAFGVSRGPIREAMQRLIQEGLLRSEPHRGVFVPMMNEADLADIYFARAALESAAVRRIIDSSRANSVQKSLHRLVRGMETAEAAGNWASLCTLDLEFHTVLVASAGSPRLDRMFRTVIYETRLCLGMLTGASAGRADLVAEHRRIIERLRDCDLPGALSALQRHFDEAIATLTTQREQADGESQPLDRTWSRR